jgi:hypothetical protein
VKDRTENIPRLKGAPVEQLPTPQSEYTHRLHDRQEDAVRHYRRFRYFVRTRSILVGAVIILALLSERERFVVKVGMLAVPAVLLEVAMRMRDRAGRSRQRAALAARFYEQRLARLEDCWAGRGRSGLRFRDENHPFAIDLDLFGPGCLFELLCTAETSLGEETLAAWLSTPAGIEEIRSRQAAVAELRSRLDLREELMALGSDVPPGGDLASLAAWGPSAPVLDRTATAVALVSTVLAGFCVAGPCFLPTGGFPLLAALLLQAGVSLWLHRRVLRLLERVEPLAPVLLPLARLVQRLEGESFSSPRLRQLQASLVGDSTRASRRLRMLGRLLRYGPFAVLLLARPLLAVWVERWRRTSGRNLALALRAVGEIEALASLAAHSFENPDDPFPEIVADGPCFQGEALGHPLLPRARCVANDVHLGGELRLLVISGSNMSGKSTLLRTIGINAVLAQTGSVVRASRLRLSPLTLGATLRVQDSLQAGRSRFFAEVLRVRMLLDLAASGPLLFLLDELFAGTSSHDRRMGAEAVVRTFLERGAIGLATTHDLSLTEIAEHLAPRAANVHFRDDVEGGALVFDYRMRPGVVPSSNGVALMRAVGIEV